jgi:peptidyl-prolyl cis-trans isomerase SurA
MALSGNFQQQAQENFKRMIKAESTTERLKAILNETIKANRGKTKDEILAIFEERKKQFALSLQQQAVASARASMLPGLRKGALEELIEERLKLQEAKRLNLLASDEEVNTIVSSIAQRNKMTLQQFAEHMKSSGGDIGAMRQRFKASISWSNVIRRRFGHQIAITERDVERFVDKADEPGGAAAANVDLKVQRVTLPIENALDQAKLAKRIQQAEAIAPRLIGCKGGAKAAAGVEGAKFEDLGKKPAASIPEPTRSLLLNAKDGEALPPAVGQAGVEVWVVCGREAGKPGAAGQAKSEDGGDNRQKEFEILAKKHLKDLRQDAFIEYR